MRVKLSPSLNKKTNDAVRYVKVYHFPIGQFKILVFEAADSGKS